MSSINFESTAHPAIKLSKAITTHLSQTLNSTITLASSIYSTLRPNSSIFYKYATKSYQNDPIRLTLEIILLVFLIWYVFRHRYQQGRPEVVLTEKEIQELIDEWEPEPLVQPLTSLEKAELERVPIYTGQVGLRAKTLDGKERLNFASYNFLGIMNNDEVKEVAIKALRKYGVGTCGPRGFYGTLDVHLQLESKIAKFMGCDDAIIYSQGFSTISSVVPAFAKRGDVIVADEAINFSIQKGVQISRSHVHYFKHNDMADLVKVLNAIKLDRKRKKLALCRQFLIVEGIYVNTGTICNLPELVEIKKEFKYRLLVEESFSIGVLGSRGAGVSDHFNIPSSDIDIVVASMSNSLGASGGFCSGSHSIIEHQRLSGQAYTYSASLPAMLTVAAIEALDTLERDSELMSNLAKNSETMLSILKKSFDGTGVVEIIGQVGSPIFHLSIKSQLPRLEIESMLQEIVDLVARDGIIITRSRYVIAQEHCCPRPSLRIAVSAGFSKREIERSGLVICENSRKIVKKYLLKI